MVKKDVRRPTSRVCERCGSMSSQKLCQACMLLDTLNLGVAKLDIGRREKNKEKIGFVHGEKGPALGMGVKEQVEAA